MAADHRQRLGRLGIIFPDDEQPGPDYELLRLEPWLARHGFGQVEAVVAFSQARRFHTHEDLLVTGDLENLLPAARTLASQGCEAVIWACTSASFIGGLDWCRTQARALGRAAGLPASSTTLAIIEALQFLAADRADILGAYPESVTRVLAACLEGAGVQVGGLRWLDSPEGAASHSLDIRGEVQRFVEEYPQHDQPLVIPDTAINTLEHVPDLEGLARRPVITANSATLWHGLRLLGVAPAAAEAGSLFGSDLRTRGSNRKVSAGQQ